MIIDKVIMNHPPPPYLSLNTSTVTHCQKPTLSALPPHILIQILYSLFPTDSSSPPTLTPSLGPDSRIRNYNARIFEDTKAEKQRKTLFWLSTSLRLVSRHIYVACMHVLRSIYLPSYQLLIRLPYTSDPFPLGVPTTSPGGSNSPPAYSSNSQSSLSSREGWASSIKSLQRETTILDRYIALKVRQDVFADDTELHIEPEEAFRDLFDVAQPQARLEDLTRIYGARQGLVLAPGTLRSRSSSKNSSITSLPISSSLTPTRSPSTSTFNQKSPKSSRSVFSFMRKSSSAPLPSTPPLKLPIEPLPFSALTVSLSPRKLGLMYNRTRTIAEVQRATSLQERKLETLEMYADALVLGLREYLEGGS